MKAENVMVRFECGAEDRMSDDFGPFEYVQLTYTAMEAQRPGEEVKPFAWFNVETGDWRIEGPDPAEWWSDVVVFGVPS